MRVYTSLYGDKEGGGGGELEIGRGWGDRVEKTKRATQMNDFERSL